MGFINYFLPTRENTMLHIWIPICDDKREGKIDIKEDVHLMKFVNDSSISRRVEKQADTRLTRPPDPEKMEPIDEQQVA